MVGGKKQSHRVESYFSGPWITHLLGSFNPKKPNALVKPTKAVAQIINVKELQDESSSEPEVKEEGEKIYGLAEIHDGYIRTHVEFTADAVKNLEEAEEFVSGCEFEDLPSCIVILEEYAVVPKLGDQLNECKLVICIQSLTMVSCEHPTYTLSTIPWAAHSPLVRAKLVKMWRMHVSSQDDQSSQSEALTQAESQAMCNLTDLVEEMKRNATQSQPSQLPQISGGEGINSQSAPDKQTDEDPPLVSGSPMHTNSHPQVEQSAQETITPSLHQSVLSEERMSHTTHTEESAHKEQDPHPHPQSDETQDKLTWKKIHQLASWVFEVPLHSDSLAGQDGDSRAENSMKKISQFLENLPEEEDESSDSCHEDVHDSAATCDMEPSPLRKGGKWRRGRKKGLVGGQAASRSGQVSRRRYDTSLSTTGVDREERLLYDRLRRGMPETTLVLLSPEDVEPLPRGFDVDDVKSDTSPSFSPWNRIELEPYAWVDDCRDGDQQKNQDILPLDENCRDLSSQPVTEDHEQEEESNDVASRRGSREQQSCGDIQQDIGSIETSESSAQEGGKGSSCAESRTATGVDRLQPVPASSHANNTNRASCPRSAQQSARTDDDVMDGAASSKKSQPVQAETEAMRLSQRSQTAVHDVDSDSSQNDSLSGQSMFTMIQCSFDSVPQSVGTTTEDDEMVTADNYDSDPDIFVISDDSEKTLAEDLPSNSKTIQSGSSGERKGFKRKLRTDSGEAKSTDPSCGEDGVPLEKRNKLSSLSSIHGDDENQEMLAPDSTDSIRVIPESKEMSSIDDQETCLIPDMDGTDSANVIPESTEMSSRYETSLIPDMDCTAVVGNPIRTSTQIDGQDRVISLVSSEDDGGSQPFDVEQPVATEEVVPSTWISKRLFMQRNAPFSKSTDMERQSQRVDPAMEDVAESQDIVEGSEDISAGNGQGPNDPQQSSSLIVISGSSREEAPEITERLNTSALKVLSGQSEDRSEDLPQSGVNSGYSIVNSGSGDKSNPEVTPTLFSSGSSSVPNSGSSRNKPGQDETPELFSSGGSTEDRIQKDHNRANLEDSQKEQGCAASLSEALDKSKSQAKLQIVGGSYDKSHVWSHDMVGEAEEEPMSLGSEDSPSLHHQEAMDLQVSSVETHHAHATNTWQKTFEDFTKIKNYSSHGSKRHTVTGSQKKSDVSPIMSSSLDSDKEITPESSLSQSIFQNPMAAKARTNLDKRLRTGSSDAVVRNNTRTVAVEVHVNEKDKADVSERSVVAVSATEDTNNESNVETTRCTHEPRSSTHQSLPQSKIYMGSAQMKQMNNKKQRRQAHFGENAPNKSVEASVDERATSSGPHRSSTDAGSSKTIARRTFSTKGIHAGGSHPANASRKAPLIPIHDNAPKAVDESSLKRVAPGSRTEGGRSVDVQENSGPLLQKQNLFGQSTVCGGKLQKGNLASGASVHQVRSMAEKLLSLNDHHHVDEDEDSGSTMSLVIPLQNIDQHQDENILTSSGDSENVVPGSYHSSSGDSLSSSDSTLVEWCARYLLDRE